jgi:hypothetical protein
MDDEDDWFLDYLDDVVFDDDEPARQTGRGLVADSSMAVGIIIGVILCVMLAAIATMR